MFGLLPDSLKDETSISLSKCIDYSEYNTRAELNTLLKGKPLLTDDFSIETRKLEMRINIKR